MNIARRAAIAAAALSIFAVNSVCTAAQQTALNINYDNSVRMLKIEGKVSDTSKELLTVRIKPYSSDWDFSNSALINSENVIAKTVRSDEAGNIELSIIIPESFIGKRYGYILSSPDLKQTGMFSAVNIKALDECVAAVSSADKKEIEEILKTKVLDTGLDNGDLQKDFSRMAAGIYGMKPKQGLSSTDFTNIYMISEGLMYVNKSEITFEKMLLDYSVYFNKNYSDEFEKLNDNQKKYLSDIMKEKIPEKSFDEEYAEAEFTARCRYADSYMQLCENVMSYAKLKGIAFSKYDSLNTYYKEKVFKDLYERRSSMSSPKEIFNNVKDLSEKYYSQANNSQSGGSGGSGGTSGGGTQFVPPLATAVPTAAPAEKPDSDSGFSDVKNHWAGEYILNVSKKGIIDGYEDNSFCPDNNVTRAELVKMITVMCSAPASNESSFDDVSSEAWYYPYISAAKEAGIIQGDGGSFRPEDKVTRQDACVMLYRAVGDRLKNGSSEEFEYNDNELISEYAAEAVSFLSEKEIISGDNGSFRPTELLTRAEAAAIISRIISNIGL